MIGNSRPQGAGFLRTPQATPIPGSAGSRIGGAAYFIPLAILMVLGILPRPAMADTFFRYDKDRYGRGILVDPLPVPPEMDAVEFLARHQDFPDWTTRREGSVLYVAEKAVDGTIPILCLHKLSREEWYGLTPDRFESLLRYLKRNKWYLVADSQYLEGDFTRVPTGMKPIVMGADDASHGNVVFQTRGDLLTGPVKRRLGRPVIDRRSMVAILERLVPPEEGRINFTFYISFDAVPFRQLDGAEDPGFPYSDIPVVAEKIAYLDDNFILGIHSLSHTYAGDMTVPAFVGEVDACWSALDAYAGGEAKSVSTLAFPYGIRDLTPALRRSLVEMNHDGKVLTGAFDFDNKLAPPPGGPGDRFEISRLNVDNRSWDRVMNTLETAPAVTARRMVIVESDRKRLPGGRTRIGAARSDPIWVLVRD